MNRRKRVIARIFKVFMILWVLFVISFFAYEHQYLFDDCSTKSLNDNKLSINGAFYSVSKKKFLIVVGIQSSHDGLLLRNAIRNTWMTYPNVYHPTERTNASMRVLFFVGDPESPELEEKVRIEAGYFKDIVYIDADDGSTGSKIIHYWEWLARSELDYVWGGYFDDSAFVRTEALEKVLINGPTERLFYGKKTLENWKGGCGIIAGPITGMKDFGYVLSKDIVQWLNHAKMPDRLKFCKANTGLRMGLWLNWLRKIDDLFVIDEPGFSDFASTNHDLEWRHRPIVSITSLKCKNCIAMLNHHLFSILPPSLPLKIQKDSSYWDMWKTLIYIASKSKDN